MKIILQGSTDADKQKLTYYLKELFKKYIYIKRSTARRNTR